MQMGGYGKTRRQIKWSAASVVNGGGSGDSQYDTPAKVALRKRKTGRVGFGVRLRRLELNQASQPAARVSEPATRARTPWGRRLAATKSPDD